MPKCSFAKLILLVSFFTGIGIHAKAQEELHLTLDSARYHALEYNKNLLNAGLAVDEADHALREAIARGLPQLDAAIDYNNFFGSTAEITMGPVPTEIEFNPTSNLNISVGQLVFSGSYIVGIQTARLFREITETSLEKSRLDIKSQVTQSYYLALVSEESKAIVKQNIENMKDIQKKTRAMVDAGVAEEVDYDQLSVQVNMLENSLRAAERQVELAHNMLLLQTGLPADTELVLTDRLSGFVSETDFHTSLATPFNLPENVDYQIMELQEKVAGKQVNLERASFLPTITGFYNYTEKLLKPEFDITPNHVIGFNISIPIFSSGMRSARVNQARINHQIAENQKELLADQLSIQEKQLRFNLNNAIEQYESQKANLEVAERVFSNLKKKYEQGLVSSLDLTTANNNYLQAENSYIQAMIGLLEAQVEMDKLLNSI